jgi:hypothetical protein
VLDLPEKTFDAARPGFCVGKPQRSFSAEREVFLA